MTAGLSRFHRNVGVCSQVRAWLLFIFKLTVLTSLPLPPGFAHTPEGSLTVHAEHSTLLVARVRRALVTDL